HSRPTATVQITWTLVGFVGAIVTSLNLYDAWRDWQALKRSGRNGDLRLMATAALRVELLRLTKMLAVIAVGIGALTSAPTITPAERARLHIPEWTTVGILLTALLFYIVIATVLQAIA